MERCRSCHSARCITLILVLLAMQCSLLPAQASAEQMVLRFLDQPQVVSSVVRLSDVVEIVSGSLPSLDQLRDIPLGPAPREGQTQTWHSSDVLQHLELRGVKVSSIRWSGKEKVQLLAAVQPRGNDATNWVPAFVDQRIIDIGTANAVLAIKEYLNLRSKSRTDWRVELSLSGDQAKMLQSRNSIASIGGGHEPWTGQQTFLLQVRNQGKAIDVSLPALISLPPMVVVATGPLRRDQMLTAEMLTYAPLPRNADERQFFTDVETLVGKQLRKSVSTHQPISDDLLGEPIIVQRNELVELESVSGAIVVRTSAKSLGSGAVGDLIDVEMSNRRRLLATVVGPAKVRISATSVPSRTR